MARQHLSDAVFHSRWPDVVKLADSIARDLDEGEPPVGIYKIGHQAMVGANAHAQEAVDRLHHALTRARAREAKKKR